MPLFSFKQSKFVLICSGLQSIDISKKNLLTLLKIISRMSSKISHKNHISFVSRCSSVGTHVLGKDFSYKLKISSATTFEAM